MQTMNSMENSEMKVMLALDDSHHSATALDNVMNRPWPTGTEFLILTVVEPFHPDYAGWDSAAVGDAVQYGQTLEAHAREYATRSAKQLSDKFGMDKVQAETKEGRIKETIIQTAIDWHADLIIMGSHGRSGIEKFLLGSVSQAVVAHAPCSVEIVKKRREQ
jgi:nucleotide-binding universal stress UspA family protein